MSSMKVQIYTTQFCPYCVQAKAFFKQKNIVFDEIDLTGKWDELEALKTRTQFRTVPQIFIDDVFIGGYTDLVDKYKKGEVKL